MRLLGITAKRASIQIWKQARRCSAGMCEKHLHGGKDICNESKEEFEEDDEGD
jgi:hypothetical protein